MNSFPDSFPGYETVEVALAWHPGWLTSVYITRFYPEDKSYFYLWFRKHEWEASKVYSGRPGRRTTFKIYLPPGLSEGQKEDCRRQAIEETWQIKDGQHHVRPGAEWAEWQHWINKACRRMVLANTASWAA